MKKITPTIDVPDKIYYVYILRCNDNTLYVGSTSDIIRRIHQHNHAKGGAHYTKIRRPVTLQYSEELSTYAKSRAREAEIKRLSRTEKMRLIAGGLLTLQDSDA